MKRRNFLTDSTVAMLGLPLSLSVLTSSLAQAQDQQSDPFADWFSVPGFDGKLKIKTIWADGNGGPASAKLIRAEYGAVVPAHTHTEGEYSFIIEGGFSVADFGTVDQKIENPQAEVYEKGQYIFMPKNSIHGPTTPLEGGVTTFVFTATKNGPYKS